MDIGVESRKNLGGKVTEIGNTHTKRSLLGHYFLLPNEIFTLGLSPGELSVYAYLMFCEDRATHQCWPSIGKICQHTGMSANMSTFGSWKRKRLIDTEPTKVKTKVGFVRNGNFLYTIRPIQEAVEHTLERNFRCCPKTVPERNVEAQTRPCESLCAVLRVE